MSDKTSERLKKARAAAKSKGAGQHPLIRDLEKRGMPRATLGAYRPRFADWAKDTSGRENVQRSIRNVVENPEVIAGLPAHLAEGAVNSVKGAYDGVKYFLDPKTAPHPTDTRADAMSARKAFDVAGMAGGGGAVAKAASKARPGGKVKSRLGVDIEDPEYGMNAIVKDDSGREIGTVRGRYSDDDKKELGIGWSHLNEELRGQGLGLKMYRRLIDEAHKRGIDVKSDRTVSHHAEKIYAKLKKQGYDVRRNPDAKIEPSTLSPHRTDKYYLSTERRDDIDKMHVFRVAKPGTKKKGFYSTGVPGLYVENESENTAERLKKARQKVRNAKR